VIPWLDPKHLWFPDPEKALDNPPGLLAAGGDLSPERLMLAYSMGIFPWFGQGQPILWWSPDPRSVMRPGEFKLRKSLRKRLRKAPYSITFDASFREVVLACAGPRSYTSETWINGQMAQAYLALHELGHAHSVEIWRERTLVGGLYGVTLGRVFFGESMFGKEPDASKIALCCLAHRLEISGFAVLDCQLPTAHLEFMGSRGMPRREFLSHLAIYSRDPSPIRNWRDLEADTGTLAAWFPRACGNPKLQ
jgi:leucyl/phenylalanyl-tRNA--protein transferase